MSESSSHREVVVVTGASGLLGASVACRLAQHYTVIGMDRPEAPDPPDVAEAVPVDVTSDDSVRQALQTVRERHGAVIASVVHLAAYYDFSGAPSPLYEQVTVRGTERLLRALQDFEVRQFQFSSTMLVHAPCRPGETINEDSPLDPKWEYPKSKVATENVIRRERGRIPAVILRIAGVYDEQGHSIPIVHQIQRIYERRLTSRLYPGDTFHGQAFVHKADVVDAIARAVDRRAELPDELTLLIGEDETLSYDYLQNTLGQLLHGEPWETTEIPKAVAKAGAWAQGALPVGEEPFIKPWMVDLADDHYALDITRARQTLGWEPQHTLRDTLPRMVAALQADPAAFYKENDLEGAPPNAPHENDN